MKQPLVSVIVPTYNSGAFLDACLQSITEQSYQNIEIIIVDQESSDNTVEIAKKHRVKIVTLPKPKFYSPPTQSRNAGASAANGQILYHLDSDMQLSPNLVEEAVSKFKDDPVLGALIVHEVDIVKGFWGRCKALERKCYWGNDNIESARIVRSIIFRQVNGYDESINSGEDFDIHKRYKKVCKIGFCKEVAIHNLGNLNFKRTISKKYSYGKSASAYLDKQQTKGSSILMEQFKSFAKNYHLFLKSPLLGSGALFLKLCEFGSGGIGYLTAKRRD